MRADGDYSDTSQTKSSASSEKDTPASIDDEATRQSQTGAIRFAGRKGEKGKVEVVANQLESVLHEWSQSADEHQLRLRLLALLIDLEPE